MTTTQPPQWRKLLITVLGLIATVIAVPLGTQSAHDAGTVIIQLAAVAVISVVSILTHGNVDLAWVQRLSPVIDEEARLANALTPALAPLAPTETSIPADIPPAPLAIATPADISNAAGTAVTGEVQQLAPALPPEITDLLRTAVNALTAEALAKLAAGQDPNIRRPGESVTPVAVVNSGN